MGFGISQLEGRRHKRHEAQDGRALGSSPEEGEKVTYRGAEGQRRFPKSQEVKMMSPALAREEGSGWPTGYPQVSASDQQALGPPGLWQPSVPGSWPGPWPLWHPGAALPGAISAGDRSCYQPRRTRKMLLLSPALIWHWLQGRGGQRRPLRLGPAHQEFSKDAHGCREDGRRGRGGWAGPPNPPPKKAGAGQAGGGSMPQCLATQQLA